MIFVPTLTRKSCLVLRAPLLHQRLLPSILHSEYCEMARPAEKKQYTDIASVMASLATFAGAVTLATLFILNCPDSRLQALLALATQLLLASPLALVVAYLLLYGLFDNDYVVKERHILVNCQFVIVGIMMAAAFLLLGSALLVLLDDVIGGIGLVLLVVIVLFTLGIGFLILCRTREAQAVNNRPEPRELSHCTKVFTTVLVILEALVLIFLLGFGGDDAEDRHVQNCTTTTTTTTIAINVHLQETDSITISETDIDVINVSISECEPTPSTLQRRKLAHRLSVTGSASSITKTAVAEASDGQITDPTTVSC